MPKTANTKKLFNSADAIVVLALLAIVCGAFFRRPIEDMLAARYHSANVTYTMEIYGVASDGNDFLREGDTIYTDDGRNIGVVESVQSTLADKNDRTSSGETKVNLTCSVSSQGYADDSGLYVGTDSPLFIAPGKTVDAHSSNHASFTFVVKTAERSE